MDIKINKLETHKSHVMWVEDNYAVIMCGASWRIPLSDFIGFVPKDNQTVWMTVDKLWRPFYLKIYQQDPRL